MRASGSGQGPDRAGDEPGLVQALAAIFACSEEVAGVIGARAADRRYAPRAVILRQGDRVGETYLVVAGRAQATVVGRDGQQMLLNEFTAGDIFGAVGQAARERQEADVVADLPLRAALFAALDFLGLLERHTCVGLAVSRMLVRQLQAINTRMVEEVILSATGRVCAELLRMADAGDGRRISPAPVWTHLGLRVHCTRETVSRIVNRQLKPRGIVAEDGDDLVIVSRRLLEDLVV